MPQSAPTYRWRLPFAVVLLCYIALAALFTLTYLRLRSESGPGGVRLNTPVASIVIPGNQLTRGSLAGAGYLASHTIQAINLPGMFGEVASSMVMRTWPDSWRPRYFGGDSSVPFHGPVDGLMVWRALCFPLYCLPFWWFAGLGLDALRNQIRLHWVVLLFGTILAVGFAVIFTGLLTQAIAEHDASLIYVFFGLLLWTALMLLFPSTWFKRLRSIRREGLKNLPS